MLLFSLGYTQGFLIALTVCDRFLPFIGDYSSPAYTLTLLSSCSHVLPDGELFSE